MRNTSNTPSEFMSVKGIEYFDFEEDFVEDNVRCIPMVVRFKMDAAGVKLKLSEWSKFKTHERVQLALMPIANTSEVYLYRQFLISLIIGYTGNPATSMATEPEPAWSNRQQIPKMLIEKAMEHQLILSIAQWAQLTDIQRFALLKLCRPGHENKNFPKAVQEFGLMNN
jgi:hypothetical protein